MNTEELKRLAEAATPGPWYDRAGVLRGTGGGIKPIATIYNGLNSPYIAAANPAAILSLLAYVDRLEAQRDRLLNACKASITVMDLLRTTGDDAKSWYAQDRNGAMVKVSDVIKSCKEAITEAESQT